MEYLEHDELLKYITNVTPGENIGFGEDFGRLIFSKLLDGLEAMHNLNIYHRDIKPNNIMIGGDDYNLKYDMELLKKHGAKSAAIESETMTVKELSSYRHFFREIEFVTTDDLSNAINEMRSIKDEEELSCIKKAQEIAETALEELLPFIRPGVTEREAALELNRLMFAHGAEDLSFDTIVLSGTNTSMPHGVPSEKKIQEGEFVLMDFGAVWNGYHSDMTRTICVGQPDEEMRKVYDIVLKAQLAGISAAKAGITGSQLDAAARDIIAEEGYGEYFGHSLGHGVGLEIHEKPNASPNYKLPLSSGAVVTVEPGIYIAGKFGVRIEDFVILNENGCENLTKFNKNLITL